jgi:hypothetical protein
MNIFLYNRYRKIYITNDSLIYIIYKKKRVYISKYFKKNGVVKKEHSHLILQKSKKNGGVGSSSNSDTLTVCSFNVYTWNGYGIGRDSHLNFDTKFSNLITNNNIELLLTQEDEIDNNDDTSESVKAYSLNDSERFSFISCINSHNEGKLQFYRGVLPRNAIIIQDTTFGITIANLHLEGGRFVDLELDDTSFDKYLEIKLGLLKEVLELSPDIILGDFNSVYSNNLTLLNKMYTDQKNYYDGYRNSELERIKGEEGYTYNLFRRHIQTKFGLSIINKCANRNSGSKNFSLENIISWNNKPFTLLQAKGYIFIEPNNIQLVGGKINPTNSRGNNIIDHVWVKQSLLDKYTFNTKIYNDFGEATDATNNLYGGISDHKPVILTIKKIKLYTKTKRRRGNKKEDGE